MVIAKTIKHGKHPPLAERRKLPRASLTDHEVELIRQSIERGELRQVDVVRKFDLSKGYVSKIVNYLARRKVSLWV